MDIFSVLSLFGGLAMFLFGMRLMGDSLKECSSGALKNVMSSMTNSPYKAFLLGLLVTVLIQSSKATIVITSGLVAAEIITLKQSLGILIGANLGTTVTGQIIRLLDINSSSAWFLQIFKPSTLAPVALIIGMALIMFFKFENSRLVGNIAMGFGILFTGLMTMTNSVSALSDADIIKNLFAGFADNPLLGFVSGVVVAFVLQSASASVGILQSFALTGMLSFKGIYAILVGIYIGDCITTAIMCSIGSKADSKRVGVVNICYNICKMVLIFAAVLIAKQVGLLEGFWATPISSGGIADANTLFNLGCAIVLLPFTTQLEKISHKIVKDDEIPVNKYEAKLRALDPVFFSTPAIAFNSCYDALLTMLDCSINNIKLALGLLSEYNEETFKAIKAEEKNIDIFADRLSNYLVQFSGSIHEDYHIGILDEYYKVISEYERLGDHAVNLAEEAQELNGNGQHLTEYALNELAVTQAILEQIMAHTRLAFEKRDIEAARHIEPLEEVVDDLVYVMKENHLERLREGRCSVYVDSNFLNILNNIERISDVCSNVGIAVVARVEPELANEAHSYISMLHKGKDENFNIEYNEAHDKYFSMLKLDRPIKEKK